LVLKDVVIKIKSGGSTFYCKLLANAFHYRLGHLNRYFRFFDYFLKELFAIAQKQFFSIAIRFGIALE